MAQTPPPVRLTARARDLAASAREHLAEADAACFETERSAHLGAAAELLGGVSAILAELNVPIVCRWSAP